jgi:hypothetical protein
MQFLLAPALLAAAFVPAAASATATGPAPLCPHLARNYASKAALPPGARAVLFPMAERGRPFQVSDAIGPGPRLPFARFVSARQAGCTLSIRYEYGGIAHGFATALLEQRGRAWIMIRERR